MKQVKYKRLSKEVKIDIINRIEKILPNELYICWAFDTVIVSLFPKKEYQNRPIYYIDDISIDDNYFMRFYFPKLYNALIKVQNEMKHKKCTLFYNIFDRINFLNNFKATIK
jgi:hypothetical protein